MSEICEHEKNSQLIDIEFNQDENFKEVGLDYKCLECGSKFTKYYRCPYKRNEM